MQRPGSPEYGFAHDLICEVAYNSILRQQREELHRRILAALEASCPGREEDVVEELCRHAVQAQDWVKADRYGYAAAKKALAKSAFRDATNCFEIAIDAVDKQPTSAMREQRAVDLRIEARMAYSPFGRTAEWLDLCRDAKARSEQIGDQSRRLASLAVRAAALNFYGTPFEAITTGEAAVTLAQELSNTTWRSFADYGLGQAYFLAGRYRDAELRFESALKRLASGSENVPPGTTGTSLRVICYMMKAITHGWLGEFDSSAVCSKRAGELVAGSGLSYDKIAAGYCRGLIQMFRGNFDEAESILAEAVSLARDNEVRLFLPLVTCALGNVYVQRGLAAKAKDLLLEAKAEAEELGHAASTLVASIYLASAYSQLGDSLRGLSVARACQVGAKQKGYTGIEALATFTEANILASQGALAAAEAIGCMKRASEIAGLIEACPLQGAAKGILGRLLADSGRTAEAQDELVQAMSLFDRSKMTIQVERAKAELSKFAKVQNCNSDASFN